jgi:hypothetical protein
LTTRALIELIDEAKQRFPVVDSDDCAVGVDQVAQ